MIVLPRRITTVGFRLTTFPVIRQRSRYLASKSLPSNEPQKLDPINRPPQSVERSEKKGWLARKVTASPLALKLFLGFVRVLGYDSPKQVAGRRAFLMYQRLCTVRADEDNEFWRNDCHLPPTFQSWFTITNLHVWLLTVRLRALPPPYGKAYIQALIDHFFLDVEDRIRAVLQPSPPSSPARPPYTPLSAFYPNPNTPTGPDVDPKAIARDHAPDRLVTRQMKIFKEQWAGMGMSFDLGLVKGDMEMAGAVWRNLLGARGASGIAFPSPDPTGVSESGRPPHFRRSVNLVGGLVEDPAEIDKIGLEVAEAQDDGSGVHDFTPAEADKYVSYPEVMLAVVTYVRRELARLEAVTDDEIIQRDVDSLRFGRVKT